MVITANEFGPWWHECALLFREHYKRPYRPPRFSDNILVPVIINSLQIDLGVTILIRVINPQKGSLWEIIVDDELVETVHRYRHEQGYSVYEIDSHTFSNKIKSHVSSRT